MFLSGPRNRADEALEIYIGTVLKYTGHQTPDWILKVRNRIDPTKYYQYSILKSKLMLALHHIFDDKWGIAFTRNPPKDEPSKFP